MQENSGSVSMNYQKDKKDKDKMLFQINQVLDNGFSALNKDTQNQVEICETLL